MITHSQNVQTFIVGAYLSMYSTAINVRGYGSIVLPYGCNRFLSVGLT